MILSPTLREGQDEPSETLQSVFDQLPHRDLYLDELVAFRRSHGVKKVPPVSPEYVIFKLRKTESLGLIAEMIVQQIPEIFNRSLLSGLSRKALIKLSCYLRVAGIHIRQGIYNRLTVIDNRDRLSKLIFLAHQADLSGIDAGCRNGTTFSGTETISETCV